MKTLIMIFFISLTVNLFSQDITFVPHETSLNDTLGAEMIFYIDVTNTTQDSQTVFIVRTENIIPPDWQSSLCFEYCFAPFVDSVATTPGIPFESGPLAPGETREVSLHVFTDQNPNMGIVKLEAGTFNDPVNRIPVTLEASTMPTSVDDANLINGFSLDQNYPNPFNPVTNLKFRIADFEFVTLKVYDVLGNEIASLINEEKSPGVYEVEFSSDDYNLSSGIYFYKLVTNNFSQTKKMVLSK